MELKLIIISGSPDRYFFYPGSIEDEDRLRVDADQGKIIEGVSYDNPPDAYRWPDGEEAPEAVLAQSVDDERDFRVFRNRRDIPPEEYRALSVDHGPISSQVSLARFLDNLADFDAMMSRARREGEGKNGSAVAPPVEVGHADAREG